MKLPTLKPRLQALKPTGPAGPQPRVASSYGKGRGGRPWRRKRERVLARDCYLCQPCKRQGLITQATEVDHIVPVFEGGSDNEDNLESICHECHEPKTRAEAKRAQRRT